MINGFDPNSRSLEAVNLEKLFPFIAVEHNVGVPMMGTRRGVAFPGGDAGSILSPRDTAGLGVKMVEYVLGGSPTGMIYAVTQIIYDYYYHKEYNYQSCLLCNIPKLKQREKV